MQGLSIAVLWQGFDQKRRDKVGFSLSKTFWISDVHRSKQSIVKQVLICIAWLTLCNLHLVMDLLCWLTN